MSWDDILISVGSNGKPRAKRLTARQWCARNAYSLRELRERCEDLERLGLLIAVPHGDGEVRYVPAGGEVER